MVRTILVYGAMLAIGTFALEWLQYRFLIQTHAAETYIALVALGFLGLGVWLGAKLFRRMPTAPFARNSQAQATLGISGRELEVLEQLAAGARIKRSRHLDLSPNTVKTHVTSLFGKLEARRRTEAILRARELGLVP